jgi:hypothetical protein
VIDFPRFSSKFCNRTPKCRFLVQLISLIGCSFYYFFSLSVLEFSVQVAPPCNHCRTVRLISSKFRRTLQNCAIYISSPPGNDLQDSPKPSCWIILVLSYTPNSFLSPSPMPHLGNYPQPICFKVNTRD